MHLRTEANWGKVRQQRVSFCFFLSFFFLFFLIWLFCNGVDSLEIQDSFLLTRWLKGKKSKNLRKEHLLEKKTFFVQISCIFVLASSFVIISNVSLHFCKTLLYSCLMITTKCVLVKYSGSTLDCHESFFCFNLRHNVQIIVLF